MAEETKKTKAGKKSAAKNTKSGKDEISGYGSGSVDVVMSVDQVAAEAALIAESAPKIPELEALTSGEAFVSLNNLRAGYGKMEILHDFNLRIGKGQSLCLIGLMVLASRLFYIRSLGLPIFFLAQLWLVIRM